ncbi:MAG: porin family protein [Nitrospinae bacterium]|nr:porin family protein [Nitrospinota bacterium]
MKRFTGFLLAGLLLLTAAPAWAQQAYLSGNIGFGIRPDARLSGAPVDIQNDPAFVIHGAIGVEMNPTIRIEGEIGLHNNTADLFPFSNEFTFSMVSFMGNGYFDIPTNSPLRPYLGAGLGFAVAGVEEDVGGLTSTDTDLVAAFQLMAGLGFDISPKATLTFGYRYFTTSDPNFFTAFGPLETEFTSHDFLFGARFRF